MESASEDSTSHAFMIIPGITLTSSRNNNLLLEAFSHTRQWFSGLGFQEDASDTFAGKEINCTINLSGTD